MTGSAVTSGRASAVSLCEAGVSQLSHGGSSPVPLEQLQRERVEIIDSYDSRWQRDPGRSNGPFS